MQMGGWRVRAENFSLVKGEVQLQAPKKKNEDEDTEIEEGSEESERKKESAPTLTPSGPATEYASEVYFTLTPTQLGERAHLPNFSLSLLTQYVRYWHQLLHHISTVRGITSHRTRMLLHPEMLLALLPFLHLRGA
jgi:hypothetical protein